MVRKKKKRTIYLIGAAVMFDVFCHSGFMFHPLKESIFF